MKSGNQNLNCLCNIPSHNTGGNLAFDRFVNKTMFERKISILDPWFFKQFQSIHLLVGEIGSFAQYFFTPIHVIIQLHGKELQTFSGVAGMKVRAPRPGVEKKGSAGSCGAAIRSQHQENGRALYDSGCVNFNRIGKTPDQII